MKGARATLLPETEPKPQAAGERGQTVYVIIVNYHREDLTARAVASALASTGLPVRAIVTDNESDGAWGTQPLARDPRVITIINHDNAGFGAACNQGMERAVAEGDCAGVLLLNNDATLEPGALAMLRAAAAEYGLAAPKILLEDGRIYSAGGLVEAGRGRCRNRGIYQADQGQFDHAETLQFASACVLFIDIAALRTGETFFEPYFLYYEDADLCLRLARAGYEVQYVPHALAHHMESASTSGPGRAAMLHYYNVRNRLLFLRRNTGFPLRLAGNAYLLGINCVRMAIFGLTGRIPPACAILQGMGDFLRGRFGPRP